VIVITSSKKDKNKLFDEIELLSKVRKALLNDKVAKKICREKDVGNWFLEGVPISFDRIKPSAKTVDSKIILNEKLAEKSFEIIMRYVIHELTHAIQHADKYGNKKQDKRNKEYLDRGSEIEAFQYQVEFDSNKRGKEKAEEYVEELLEYHDLSGDDKADKRVELLSGVS
tara:strand:+ start:728 stop:1237 length:510 start_codon:yes stop_codon:yes gene_type:complete